MATLRKFKRDVLTGYCSICHREYEETEFDNQVGELTLICKSCLKEKKDMKLIKNDVCEKTQEVVNKTKAEEEKTKKRDSKKLLAKKNETTKDVDREKLINSYKKEIVEKFKSGTKISKIREEIEEKAGWAGLVYFVLNLEGLKKTKAEQAKIKK